MSQEEEKNVEIKDLADSEEHKSENPEQEEQENSPYENVDSQELRELLKERDEVIEHLQSQVGDLKDSRLRKVAEFENYRKRVKRERSKIYDTAKISAIEDFLAIYDDLHRTLQAAEDLDVNETFLDGVMLLSSKFEEVLKDHGVERIDEKGVPFNVDLHDAMMRQKPEDKNVESNVVLNVIENGYRMGERTIRHAKVIVSE